MILMNIIQIIGTSAHAQCAIKLKAASSGSPTILAPSKAFSGETNRDAMTGVPVCCGVGEGRCQIKSDELLHV